MPAMKRTAAAAAAHAPAAKVSKATESVVPKLPKSGPLAQVIKGLAASDLPKDAQAMLGEMLAPSLGVCKEERGKFQSKVVDMVGGVLAAVDEAMKGKVEESDALILEDEQAKDELETNVATKGSDVETKHAEVLTKKCELAEVAKSFKRAREVTEETKAHGRNAEVEAIGRVKEREMLGGILEDFQKSAEDGSKASDVVKRLAPLDIGESLMVALPAVLSKAASERSSFDAMVLTSVQQEIDKRITAVDEAIQNAEPVRAANADALHKADAALEELADRQVDGADAYWKVAGEEEQLEKEVAELHQAVRKLKETSRKHQSLNAKAKTALEAFQGGSRQVFEQLREAAEEVAPDTAAAPTGEAVPEPAQAASGE